MMAVNGNMADPPPPFDLAIRAVIETTFSNTPSHYEKKKKEVVEPLSFFDRFLFLIEMQFRSKPSFDLGFSFVLALHALHVFACMREVCVWFSFFCCLQ
jgi:hypothetical protein